ncbi:MAG: response regulator [Paenibacillus sp.]|nr:response regulator [Paenibacillus sp.]
MYKVFIVVGNDRDRREMADSLDWSSIGLDVAGVFSSGLEALQEAERTRPDIVLIDVYLPAMDGLMLGRRIRERYPSVQLIFIGGDSDDDDFAHANTALSRETDEEVRTPVSKSGLHAAVVRAVRNAARERSFIQEREYVRRQIRDSLPHYQEQFLRELLLGSYRDCDPALLGKRMQFLEIGLPANGNFRVVLLRTANGTTGEAEIPDCFRFMHHLERALEPVADRREYFIRMIPISDVQLAIVAGGEGEPRHDDVLAFEQVLLAEEQMEEALPHQLSIGVSRQGKLAELPELYAQSVRAVEDNPFCDRTPRVVFQDEIDEEDRRNDRSETVSDIWLHDIRGIIYADRKPDVSLLLDRFLGGRESSRTDRDVREFMVLLSGTLQRLYVEAGISVNGLILFFLSMWNKLQSETERADILASTESLIGLARSQLLEEQRSVYDQVTKQIKRVIMKRYMEPITIRSITDGVHLSMAHANYIFKHKSGRTILDYLTEYRMEKAKSLLRGGESELHSVARQVGYASKSHFCLSFKRVTGLTPSEYINPFRD